MLGIRKVKSNLYQFTLNNRVARETADCLFERGVAAAASGNIDEAFKLYQRALKLNPQATGALVNLGTIYHSQRKLDLAEERYRKAIEFYPKYALAHYNLGVVLEDKGLPQEATLSYLEALSINPAYADAHYNLAMRYELLGENRKALLHYELYHRYLGKKDMAVCQRIGLLRASDLLIVAKSSAAEKSKLHPKRLAHR